MKKIFWLGIFCLILTSMAVKAADGVAVIVNPANTDNISRSLISKIYMGKAKYWADGSPIFAVNQAESLPVYDSFYRGLLKKSPALVRTIWTQNIFTGKQLPPKTLDPDAEVRRLVRENKNAIGYIQPSYVDDTVKVVTP